MERKVQSLKVVDQILEDIDRTPAWLCRQAGVHRCNYTLIKKGQQKISDQMMDKFSRILGIRKEILFPNNKQEK